VGQVIHSLTPFPRTHTVNSTRDQGSQKANMETIFKPACSQTSVSPEAHPQESLGTTAGDNRRSVRKGEMGRLRVSALSNGDERWSSHPPHHCTSALATLKAATPLPASRTPVPLSIGQSTNVVVLGLPS
jgi:hypothetical protein